MFYSHPLVVAIALIGQADLPKVAGPVDDRINLLPAAVKTELTTAINDLEQTDSTQVVVLVVPTTAPYSIEEYANRTFNQNGIGQKTSNNGVLIVVARDDRRCRIEVGYGLEGRLTDALSSQIIRQEMVPRFKAGDYAGGIAAGTRTVIAAVKGEYKLSKSSRAMPWFAWVFIVLWALVFFGVPIWLVYRLRRLARRGRRGWGWAAFGGSSWPSMGSWGSSWGSGGSSWSSGSGSSGWSGGGGSSGGGGASGSW